jgi:hypothetical protein
MALGATFKAYWVDYLHTGSPNGNSSTAVGSPPWLAWTASVGNTMVFKASYPPSGAAINPCVDLFPCRNEETGYYRSAATAFWTTSLASHTQAATCSYGTSGPSQPPRDTSLGLFVACPSPPPVTPPFASPAASTTISSVVLAAGVVSDYDSSKQTAMRQVIATAAGVDVSAVTISIEPASVRITFGIEVPTESLSTTLTTLNTGIFASSIVLSNAFAAGGVYVTITTIEQSLAADRTIDITGPYCNDITGPFCPRSSDDTGLVVGLSVGLGLPALIFAAYVVLFLPSHPFFPSTNSYPVAKVSSPGKDEGLTSPSEIPEISSA